LCRVGLGNPYSTRGSTALPHFYTGLSRPTSSPSLAKVLTHTTDLLDLTSLTVDEFEALVSPFEAAFLRYMAAWTLHGRRRQSRRYTTYQNCPLPTPADRLLFILVYLKQNTIQTLHGCLFGMRQSKANQWMHVLLPVLRNTLRTLGDAPCRSLDALRERCRVEWLPLPLASSALASSTSEDAPAATPKAAPLFVMTAPSDPSRAPQTRLNRPRARAARKSGTC
jgi:hypothetical protein